MAGYTKNYNLVLPAKTEKYDIETANTNNENIDKILFGKVDKIPGKDLSQNDFTNAYKQKLDTLKNYDDTVVKKDIADIQKEQISQNTEIESIKTKNEEQENKLTEIEQEQANQDDKINTNEANILNLQEVETLQNKTIEELQQENIEQSKTIETLKEEKAELEKNLDSVLVPRARKRRIRAFER